MKSKRWLFPLAVIATFIFTASIILTLILVNSRRDESRQFIEGSAEPGTRADVILVLGGGLQRNGAPGFALTRRSAWAAGLWRDGAAPMVLCSGGVGIDRPRSEAEGCRDVLIANGVPESAIVLEMNSKSTEENAAFSRPILEANGWTRVILVSDGYHLLRARWIFAHEGITIWQSPAPPPSFMEHFRAITREVVAFGWLGVKELFALPWSYVPGI